MARKIHVGLLVFNDVDYGLDLADALCQIGLSVTLYLSHQHAAGYMGTIERVAERIHDMGLLPRECAVRLFSLPRIRDPRSMLVINRISQAMRKDRVDVVHLLVGPGEFWVAALALRLRSIPVASTMIIPKPNVGESMPAFVAVGIYRMLAWGSDVIIVNGTDQVRIVQDLYHLPPDRVAYVPLGPRTTAVKWAKGITAEEPGTVLFFGAARPHKGLQYLVEAQPLITARVPHARILVASRGEELERCKAMVQDSSKFELYEGFVPGEIAAAFFQRSSLIALPYLSASTSGILTTAYAFGKPVVATSVGCLPEYVEEGVTGLLVPPADVEKLADRIVMLLSDDALRDRMGQEGRRWAEEKRKTVALETLQAYEKAITLRGKK